MITKYVQTALIFIALTVILSACSGCGGDDPVQPTPPPRITNFSAVPLDIMPGDSSLLDYRITDADSSKIFPDGSRLSPTSDGDKWVKPTEPTTYWLVGYNSVGRDSATLRVTMNGAVAVISEFSFSPPVVLIGDSTELTWETDRADSIIVDNGLGRLTPVDSGSLWLKPTVATTYRAIAYNNVGRDTVEVGVTVENPTTVVAGNGAYYKGIMGSNTLIPTLDFRVEDALGAVMTLPWIQLTLTEGDGTLTPDSLQGSGVVNYAFSGGTTHAVVQALVHDIDTTEAHLRTNAIVPGVGGQGQYVILDDPYSAVLALNGNPEKVDSYDFHLLNYADYETTLGVVFGIFDIDDDEIAEEAEPVYVVIFTANFTGARTADSIGIGSTLNEVWDVYGDADSTYYDDDEPVAQVFIYRDEGLTFYTDTLADSTVFELHLQIPSSGGKAPAMVSGASALPSAAVHPVDIRRYSRP